MRSKCVAAVAAMLALPLLFGCGKSASSSSGSAVPVPVSAECEATGNTADGQQFTVHLTIAPVGPVLAPNLAVSVGQRKIGGLENDNLVVQQVTMFPKFQSGAKVTRRIDNGHAMLPLPRGAGRWVPIGSSIPVSVQVNVSTGGNSEEPGECETTLDVFRRVFFCLLKDGQKALRIIIQFTKREGGWVFKVVESRGGYQVSLGKKLMNVLGDAKLTVAEGIGSAARGAPRPLLLKQESDVLPPGSTIQIYGYTFAGQKQLVPRRALQCNTDPIPLSELLA